MNPDDFKSQLLRALGMTPAPATQPSKSGALLAAALGHTPRMDPNATDPQSRYGQLMESPFADTLSALIGRPSAFRMAPLSDDQPGDLGEYVAKRGPNGKVQSDTIYLTPELMERRVGTMPQGVPRSTTPEYALAHEMAHRERATGQAPKAVAQQDSVMHEQYKGDLPNKYWATNSDEHYAESFANAITYLRATGREQPNVLLGQRLAPVAQKFERAVPGTMLQVQRLLQNPIYSNHPLNLGASAPLAQSDVTAVRKP